MERERPTYRAFYISLDIPFYLKGPKKRASSMFPKSGAPMETDSHSRALTYLSGSPVQEPSFHVPLIESPRREMPLFLLPSFIHHSKSLVYEPPS
jgi:hypothetical protein